MHCYIYSSTMGGPHEAGHDGGVGEVVRKKERGAALPVLANSLSNAPLGGMFFPTLKTRGGTFIWL
jgi:hypothetical protein